MQESISLLCLDAEMVDDQRLIELSVYDFSGKEVFHSYFNPGPVRVWREEIHHISRSMVRNAPRFGRRIPELESLIGGADYLIGCAISNDISALSRQGLGVASGKNVIEIQDWYWLLFDFEAGESLYRTRSLLAIAEALGVDFDESMAHGASPDTLATLRCFKALIRIFKERFMSAENPTLPQVLAAFDERFAAARTDFLRRDARGFVQLLKYDGYYTLKFNRTVQKPHARAIGMIEVADRFIAEYELRKLFARRSDRDSIDILHLKPSDINKFRSYTNDFDEERSALCRSLASSRLNRHPSPLRLSF